MRAASAAPAAAGSSPALARRSVERLAAAAVQGIPLRVSIVGTRGKGTLAAAVAAALRRRGLAVHCNAPGPAPAAAALTGWRRQAAAYGLPAGDSAVLDATAAQVRGALPTQALVLANRARSPAGMRRLHAEVCMPHYVLLPNVRRDPAGLALRPLATEARRLVRSITPGALVVLGEPDPIVRSLLRRECERAGLAVLDTPARRAFPGSELVAVLDAFLLHRLGQGLEPDEEAALRQELQARFRWQPSSIPGVRWFDAAPLRDLDTTQIALNHLQSQRRMPVTFVAYLRADRPGRTRAYTQFLAELLAAPDTRQVVLCGHRAQAVADRLQPWAAQVRVVADDLASLPRVVRRLQFDCQGGAIVTLANHRGAWPEELARLLQRPGVQRPAAAAAAPQSAPAAVPAVAPVAGAVAVPAVPAGSAAAAMLAVPKRIVRPLVAAAPVPSAQLGFAMPPSVAVPLAAAAAALPSAGPVRKPDLR